MHDGSSVSEYEWFVEFAEQRVEGLKPPKAAAADDRLEAFRFVRAVRDLEYVGFVQQRSRGEEKRRRLLRIVF